MTIGVSQEARGMYRLLEREKRQQTPKLVLFAQSSQEICGNVLRRLNGGSEVEAIR
jgi:hypothetical protein